MTKPNVTPRLDGSLEDYMDDEERLLYGNRLPDDFPERLARLRELAGLTWSGFARAIGVDYRQMYKWRKHGVEPSGAAMDRLYKFASRLPGGLAILLGKEYQMTFLRD